MKPLQNNYTTPEQSKRLLELGVPADSADCYYYEPFGKYNFIYILQNGTSLKETERRQRIVVHPDTKLFPCWSVGRLIEIAHICSGRTLSYKEEANEIQKFKEEHKCKTIIEAVILCLIKYKYYKKVGTERIWFVNQKEADIIHKHHLNLNNADDIVKFYKKYNKLVECERKTNSKKKKYL